MQTVSAVTVFNQNPNGFCCERGNCDCIVGFVSGSGACGVAVYIIVLFLAVEWVNVCVRERESVCVCVCVE